MLPFLKPKRQAGIMISERKPDGGFAEQNEQAAEDQGLEACADDIIRAINSKDSRELAAAIRAAFEILDSEPHVEGPHINENEE